MKLWGHRAMSMGARRAGGHGAMGPCPQNRPSRDPGAMAHAPPPPLGVLDTWPPWPPCLHGPMTPLPHARLLRPLHPPRQGSARIMMTHGAAAPWPHEVMGPWPMPPMVPWFHTTMPHDRHGPMSPRRASGASGGSRGGKPGAHQEHDAPQRAGISDVSKPGARKKGV